MENEIQTTTEAQPEVTDCEAMATQNSEFLCEENGEASSKVKCLNCGTEFEGKFCPECGQSADTGRFTMKFIWQNLLAAFLSKDGGIWFTLKNLFTRPGTMIVDMLNGKRVKYFSPFPMLFCSLTLFVLIISFSGSHNKYRDIESRVQDLGFEVTYNNSDTEDPIIDDSELVNVTTKRVASKVLGFAIHFYNNHYTLVYMLTIPFFVMAARICYGKDNRKRYNRAEYVVAITYASVIVVLYRCLVSLSFMVSSDVSDWMKEFMPIVIIIAFTACFNKMMGFSIGKTIWRSVLTTGFYFLLLANLILLAFITFLAYLVIKLY